MTERGLCEGEPARDRQGEARGAALRRALEAGPLERGRDQPAPGGAGGVKPGEVPQHLAHAEGRRKDRRLRGVPERRPCRGRPRRHAHHCHRARVRGEQPSGNPEQRRLAGAVRSDERRDFPSRDLEGHVGHRGRVASVATAPRDTGEEEYRRVHTARRANSWAVPATPPTTQQAACAQPTGSPLASAS